MRQLAGDRGWEYAYKKALEEQLAVYREQLEASGEGPTQYLRGVIYGIRVAIGEMSEARLKHRQDGDADFEE
jgi:hypothetical protein